MAAAGPPWSVARRCAFQLLVMSVCLCVGEVVVTEHESSLSQPVKFAATFARPVYGDTMPSDAVEVAIDVSVTPTEDEPVEPSAWEPSSPQHCFRAVVQVLLQTQDQVDSYASSEAHFGESARLWSWFSLHPGDHSIVVRADRDIDVCRGGLCSYSARGTDESMEMQRSVNPCHPNMLALAGRYSATLHADELSGVSGAVDISPRVTVETYHRPRPGAPLQTVRLDVLDQNAAEHDVADDVTLFVVAPVALDFHFHPCSDPSTGAPSDTTFDSLTDVATNAVTGDPACRFVVSVAPKVHEADSAPMESDGAQGNDGHHTLPSRVGGVWFSGTLQGPSLVPITAKLLGETAGTERYSITYRVAEPGQYILVLNVVDANISSLGDGPGLDPLDDMGTRYIPSRLPGSPCNVTVTVSDFEASAGSGAVTSNATPAAACSTVAELTSGRWVSSTTCEGLLGCVNTLDSKVWHSGRPHHRSPLDEPIALSRVDGFVWMPWTCTLLPTISAEATLAALQAGRRMVLWGNSMMIAYFTEIARMLQERSELDHHDPRFVCDNNNGRWARFDVTHALTGSNDFHNIISDVGEGASLMWYARTFKPPMMSPKWAAAVRQVAQELGPKGILVLNALYSDWFLPRSNRSVAVERDFLENQLPEVARVLVSLPCRVVVALCPTFHSIPHAKCQIEKHGIKQFSDAQNCPNLWMTASRADYVQRRLAAAVKAAAMAVGASERVQVLDTMALTAARGNSMPDGVHHGTFEPESRWWSGLAPCSVYMCGMFGPGDNIGYLIVQMLLSQLVTSDQPQRQPQQPQPQRNLNGVDQGM